MEIIKRNGTIVEYQKEKIEWAMRKSFAGVEEAIDEAKISAMADAVERFIIDHPRSAMSKVSRMRSSSPS